MHVFIFLECVLLFFFFVGEDKETKHENFGGRCRIQGQAQKSPYSSISWKIFKVKLYSYEIT